jgi:hypothetical protein
MITQPATNLLLAPVEFQLETTPLGNWRRFVYPNGELFAEFVSHRQVRGWPLLHYTRGRNPETGRRIVAKGVFAIGRLAVGLVAIGQASAGVFAIGQLAIGLLFGLGQATTGVFALGQFVIAVLFAAGQFSLGYVAIGQFAIGKYALAQIGIGEYVWDTRDSAPQAVAFFKSLVP